MLTPATRPPSFCRIFSGQAVSAIFAGALILGGACWHGHAAAAAPGLSDAVLVITVNTQPKGEFFAFQTTDGDYLIKRADLDKLGLPGLQGSVVQVDGESYVSLRSARGITVRLDPKTLTLQITATPALLGKGSSIDLLPARRPGVFEPHDTSAFVNYRIGYTNAVGAASYSAGTELGARAGEWLLLTQSSHALVDNHTRSLRLMSSVTRDWRDRLQRLILGDFFTQPAELGSTLTLGGLSFSKLYSIDPYLVTQPMADLAGAIGVTSEAKIYVDGLPVRTEKLSPGEFLIQNLNYYGGARDVQVVIRDPFGREQQYTYRYYFTDALLRTGLQEYSYNIGAMRRNFGTVSNDYGPAAISFFHRRGFTENLTLGIRGEAAERRLNFGPRATLRLGSFGIASASLAASRDDAGARGGAAQLNYGYQTRTLNLRVLARRFTRKYAFASGPSISELRPRADTSAGFGWGLPSAGNFGVDYSRSTQFTGPGRRAATLSYSRSIGGHWNLFATLSRVRDSTSRTEFFVGLTWYPTRDVSASYTHDTRFGQRSDAVEVNKNAPLGEGWGYRVTAARGDGDATSASPFVQYNSRNAIYTASIQTQDTPGSPRMTTYGVTMAGALGYVGGTLGSSRPISDSFGVAKVGEIPNVRVYQSNQVIGRTDGSGSLFIPNLASYVDNQIAIEDKDVPLDYTISDKERYVSPPLRSGSLIRFAVKRVQAVTGTLRFRRGTALETLEYHDGSLVAGGKPIDVFTGKGGVFYIENLEPGRYPLSMATPAGKCSLDLTVPRTQEAIVDLGSLACESVH